MGPQDIDQLFSRFRRTVFGGDPNLSQYESQSGAGNFHPSGFLDDGSVAEDTIVANAVTATKISAGSVTTTKLAAGAVTANEIAANAIEADKIKANAVTAGKIAALAVEAGDIAANAVTADEIAANSIETAHIVAANVTSAKIELTLSGKNYGANDGSLSSPGVFFDSSGDVGLTVNATGTDVIMGSGSGVSDPFWQVGPGAGGAMLGQAGDLFPGTDNSFSCGISGARWLDVWAVDGTINTSDRRLKRDIRDAPLGLDFILTLRPRAYRWKDTADTQAREGAVLDNDALLAEVTPHKQHIESVRRAQLAGELSDEEAEAAVAEERRILSEIRERYVGPVMGARMRRRPGRRDHYGFVAQEVKEALDVAGIDAAFWKETPSGEQALSYGELISPLVKAVQELAARVRELESGAG